MGADLFGEAAEVLRSLLPPELDQAKMRARRYGLKVWFGGAEPAKEHYEAQVVGPSYVPGTAVVAVEVGFHAEYPRPDDNERVLGVLAGAERKWRRVLGREPVAGPFLGHDGWRRLSETWVDPDLSDPDLPVDIGTRLLDYIAVLEPLRAIP